MQLATKHLPFPIVFVVCHPKYWTILVKYVTARIYPDIPFIGKGPRPRVTLMVFTVHVAGTRSLYQFG